MSDPQRKKKIGEQFISWLNGEYELKSHTLFIMECRLPRPVRPEAEYKKIERRHLQKFFGWYPLAAGLICVVLVGILLSVVLAIPAFGQPDNPINNEVSEHYLEYTEEETGSTNAVTGMILSYRGFDTLGESCVLFLALTSVMFLLRRDEKDVEAPETRIEKGDAERDIPDTVLEQAAKVLIPFIFLFAAYVLLNGETSPGGGFSGGTILGCALILLCSAFGFDRIHVFFSRRMYDRFRIFGLVLYAVLYGYNIFVGANRLGDPLSAAIGSLSLPIDLAVGLVVACTVYGFYALFARGEL